MYACISIYLSIYLFIYNISVGEKGSRTWNTPVQRVMFVASAVDRPELRFNKTQSYVWHDSFTCATWLIRMCGMLYSYVRYDSFICVAWLMQLVRSKANVKFLMRICCITRLYVWHDPFICVTLTRQIDSYLWHDAVVCVMWLVHVRDMTFSYVWLESFT